MRVGVGSRGSIPSAFMAPFAAYASATAHLGLDGHWISGMARQADRGDPRPLAERGLGAGQIGRDR